MHCLNLKSFTSLSLPSRVSSSSIKDHNLRFNRIVACSVPGTGSGSGSVQGANQSPLFSRTETYALLKQQLEVAAKSEDAARYRDELKEIAPHCLLKCSSDATTLGIRVQVRSVYIEGRSQPSKGLYFFAYRIRITNNSDRPVQLLRRHWIITDANGKTESVHGIGVIGEQPVILPNTGFEYSSACPLSTPNGRMEGDFEMKHIDKIGARTFNVAIAPFSLSTFGDGVDAI
ncbi:hypothetical protein BUALT_Bualt07G0028900 [Buddleja alternifolia]|uniref:ApaG domain-containing protein n=1 Tax=Buddleja alternifolia TaxID=168488 RepID=A0AAV6XID1_9LAMI|nr:hypothetical protein BUALT_Bualt07G0028900 [Buddleja alternifolia]